MDKHETLKALQAETARIWDDACEIWPELVKVDPPRIELNFRRWRVAGMAFTEEFKIEMSFKFFQQGFAENMMRVILPHEIAHIIDDCIYNVWKGKPHHGETWRRVMLALGQEPKQYHSMMIDR